MIKKTYNADAVGGFTTFRPFLFRRVDFKLNPVTLQHPDQEVFFPHLQMN